MNHLEEKSNKREGLRFVNGFEGFIDRVVQVVETRENQYTPMYYHWNKMEDIINRGGGNLQIIFHKADDQDLLSAEDLTLSFDGAERHIQAGRIITLHPVKSVSIPQKVFHTFYGEEGTGPVLTGAVSMVNDDSLDNNFLNPVERFPDIEEDEILRITNVREVDGNKERMLLRKSLMLKCFALLREESFPVLLRFWQRLCFKERGLWI